MRGPFVLGVQQAVLGVVLKFAQILLGQLFVMKCGIILMQVWHAGSLDIHHMVKFNSAWHMRFENKFA